MVFKKIVNGPGKTQLMICGNNEFLLTNDFGVSWTELELGEVYFGKEEVCITLKKKQRNVDY